jgi:cytochrome c oxidase subunit I
MCASFFMESGAAKSGWTNYSPLAGFADGQIVNQWLAGQTQWLIGLVLLITSSLLGSVNFITTIINLRARGMTWMRMPFFVWAMLVTGFLLLLAFPPLEAAGIMQLMDRVAHSSFFMPSGLFTKSEGLADLSGGGSPLLFQHLFWFLGHPEVYVLLLPAFACVAEIIPANTRKPLWGYKSMVYSVLVLGFLSFIVWAHHMYMTGMGAAVSTFFQTTTVLISIPSVIIITAMLISLWGGSIRFTPPMLWACAFIPMFGIGGLTGLPLAFNLADLHLHDTYYVIGHFHYVVAPGHPVRLLRRRAPLVSENHRPLHEFVAQPPALLAQPDLHEHHLLPDAAAGHGRLPPPLVQRRRRLPRQGRRQRQRLRQHRAPSTST